jgi:C4-dicarboxylate-specific signal transduction histidine kinase
MLHPQTVLLLTAAFFFVLPLLVWWSTAGSQIKGVHTWCAGSLLAGLGLSLLALRPWFPVWVSFHLANTCLLVCYVFWAQSLRIAMDRAWSVGVLVLLVFTAAIFYSLLYQTGEATIRGMGMRLATVSLSLSVSYMAWQLGTRTNSRNAQAIAVSYLLLALGIALQVALQGSGGSQPSPFSATWDARAVALLALATSAVSHLCYGGLVLDHAANLRLQARQAQWEATQNALRDAERHAVDSRSHTAQLAAGLVHELNLPLSQALAHAQEVQRVLQLQSPALQKLEGLLEQTQEAITQASNSLDRVRHAGKSRALSLDVVDLRQVAHAAVALLESEQTSLEVELVYPPEGDALGCLGNELALSQVLVNLLRSAVMVGDLKEKARYRLECGGDVHRVWVRVRDHRPSGAQTSSGPDQQPQAGRSASGLGMGLAISQALIQQHRGQMTWRHLPQGGTEAVLELPRWPEAHA